MTSHSRCPSDSCSTRSRPALDEHLVAIADAIHARQQLLHTVRSATAIAELSIGDTVMFNRRIRPRYLEHELAVIEGLDDHWVTVRPWRPVGRFGGWQVRCPPLALQRSIEGK
jgi:hypothetical protein